MARNPRPLLIFLLAIDLLFLLSVIALQTGGYPELAPLSGMLTALFGAFLAALIALSTVDYLNERTQFRAWARENIQNALGPVYEEVVANTGGCRTLKQASCHELEELFLKSRGVHVSRTLAAMLDSYRGAVVEQQDSHQRAWDRVQPIVYETCSQEFRSKIPDTLDTELASFLLQRWRELLDGDTSVLLEPREMKYYIEQYERVGRGAPVQGAQEFLRKLKGTIAADPAVVLFKVKSAALLARSESLLDELRVVMLRPWEHSVSG